jgi:peptide deformylase
MIARCWQLRFSNQAKPVLRYAEEPDSFGVRSGSSAYLRTGLGQQGEILALLKISRMGHPVLREIALPVDASEIQSKAFQQFIDDMIDTMRESDGVGLAAPQVYAAKRVAIVEVKGPHPRYPNQPEVPLTVLINPQVISHSDELEEDWEGCLSIPDLRGRVPRWKSVQVRALNRTGEPIEISASGFFARVIQHELDHLDGVMFLDRMSDLKTLTHLREFQKYWLTS